jgi:putative heme degradation protein
LAEKNSLTESTERAWAQCTLLRKEQEAEQAQWAEEKKKLQKRNRKLSNGIVPALNNLLVSLLISINAHLYFVENSALKEKLKTLQEAAGEALKHNFPGEDMDESAYADRLKMLPTIQEEHGRAVASSAATYSLAAVKSLYPRVDPAIIAGGFARGTTQEQYSALLEEMEQAASQLVSDLPVNPADMM